MTNFVKKVNFAAKSYPKLCLEVVLKLFEAKLLFENVKVTNSFQNNQRVPSRGYGNGVT